MNSEHPGQEPSPPQTRRFQYTLREMLAVMTAAGLVCALFFTVPILVAAPIMVSLTIATAPALTVAVVYGRGYVRAFCIAALFPAGAAMFATCIFMMFQVGDRYPQDGMDRLVAICEQYGAAYRVFAGASWVLTVLTGLLGVGVWWLVQSSGKSER